MISPTPQTLETLFTSSKLLKVPKNQRQFAWGKNEALEFIEDLKSYAGTGQGDLFLGTMIFCSADGRDDFVKIVDGQQRITTALLLLIACRNLAKAINSIGIANIIQQRITFVDSTTAQSLGTRLISSESIKDVFEYMANFDWNGDFPNRIGNRSVKRQVNRVKSIFTFFYEQIHTFDQDTLSRFLKAIYNAYIARIDIQDEAEAFSIFERTNARGIDLEASDLLKNFLFAQEVENLEEAWRQIVDNSEGTMLRMLKYFYVAKKGPVLRSELYRKIKSYSQTIGAPQLVNELDKFAKYYSFVQASVEVETHDYFEFNDCGFISNHEDQYAAIHLTLEGLRLFNISQIYPLIYSAIESLRRLNGSNNSGMSKKLVQLFVTLEKYHFINNAICDRVGNEIEKLYADFCVNYSECDDFVRTTDELINILKGQLASEQEFMARFVDISYSAETIPLIVYIFDRMDNIWLHPGERVRIFNPDRKILRRNHNIEHFYPQTPQGGVELLTEMVDAIDNIGNLLVVSFRTNSKLGNVTPVEKIKLLKSDLRREIQNHISVQEFVEKYEGVATNWGAEQINKRANELAQLAYRSVWNMI
ncbi:MAG: DUF262 domain-containing protein [Candidatus Omnitrophota bacterium]|nr:DUF262 domain-containing protein [Candidatus Omnitrophota bacterium]